MLKPDNNNCNEPFTCIHLFIYLSICLFLFSLYNNINIIYGKLTLILKEWWWWDTPTMLLCEMKRIIYSQIYIGRPWLFSYFACFIPHFIYVLDTFYQNDMDSIEFWLNELNICYRHHNTLIDMDVTDIYR